MTVRTKGKTLYTNKLAPSNKLTQLYGKEFIKQHFS